MALTAAQWRDSGLIPSGLLAWHMFEAGASGNHIIYDYSGNNRHIDSAVTNAPVLLTNVLYGQPGWYFNGNNTVPLNWAGSITINHAFVLAAHEDAAFNLNRGLLTGETSGDILVSNSSGSDFFDLARPNFSYLKSDVPYALNNQEAPMGGVPELIEIIDSDGIALDGIQVGKQRDLAGRIWKGHFFEQLLYNRILSLSERRRVMLYFNLRFSQWRTGLPFRFPSDDLMQFRRSRFYSVPPEYRDITDHFEFEDRGRTFNEAADTPPLRWEYGYRKRTAEQTVIFDEFWNQARIAHPFTFLETHRDGRQIEWADVRIEDYNRKHDAHKSFENDIEFKLVKYP